MFDNLFLLPISFWAVMALLSGGGIWAFRRMKNGLGIPMLAVLATVAVWYVGDAFYNDYANNHAKLFPAHTLTVAWWQVAWFIAAFLLLTPFIHQRINRRSQHRRSGVMQMFSQGVDQAEIQQQLNAMFRICAVIWAALFVIASFVLKAEILHYLFPFWGYKASPWVHGRMGIGFDFCSILAVYLNLLVASIFGIVAALSTTPRIRHSALLLCLLTWSYFIFDRARNTMLVLVIPTLLCWIFLRLRGRMWLKVLLLLASFLAVNSWMKFVIANRTDMNIVTAFNQKGLNFARQKDIHNEGLNMFEELCWINKFMEDGIFPANWGAGYFSEIVNPIPRALWPGKPTIGLDYAIARGHAQADDTQGGVNTTIATGLIGQGVVNFGCLLGPAAAALLMSLWVALLARLDLNIHALGRLPLYALGLILTFNMGRDITLIILYPFAFGALAVWWLDRSHQQPAYRTAKTAGATAEPAPRNATSRPPSLFVRRDVASGFAGRKSPPMRMFARSLNQTRELP